jgi:hypothetical protein
VVPHHQGAGEARAVLEADLERTDVRHDLLRAVGQQHLALAHFLQPQPITELLRDADVQRGGVGKRIDFQRELRSTKKDRVHDARS